MSISVITSLAVAAIPLEVAAGYLEVAVQIPQARLTTMVREAADPA